MVSYVETWFDAEAQLGRRRKLCSRWLGKLPGSDLMSLSTIASLPSRSAKHGILCRDLVRCGSTTWETTKTMFALVGETPRFVNRQSELSGDGWRKTRSRAVLFSAEEVVQLVQRS